jgi:hypothetical protein
MGWLKLGARSAISGPPPFEKDLKINTEHVENVSMGPEAAGDIKPYPFIGLDTPDESLPFIQPEEVTKRNSIQNGGLREY